MSKRNHRRALAREMQQVIRTAREHGLVVEFGRFGSYTVFDPRFDQIEACRDCMGSGIDPDCRCPHTYPDGHLPCATCEGRGTVRTQPASEPIPITDPRVARYLDAYAAKAARPPTGLGRSA